MLPVSESEDAHAASMAKMEARSRMKTLRVLLKELVAADCIEEVPSEVQIFPHFGIHL